MTTPKPRNDKQMADYIEDTLDGIAESIDEVHGDMLPMVAFGVMTPAQIQLQRAQTSARLCLLEAYALLAAERERLMKPDDDAVVAESADPSSHVAVVVTPDEKRAETWRVLVGAGIKILNDDPPVAKTDYPPLDPGNSGLIIWDSEALRADQFLIAANLAPIEVISEIEVL